jgi:hypothetical protein
MERSSAVVQETLRVRSSMRCSSARQAPMSCWRRGGDREGIRAQASIPPCRAVDPSGKNELLLDERGRCAVERGEVDDDRRPP